MPVTVFLDFKDPNLRYHHVLDLLSKAESEKRALGEMSVNSKVRAFTSLQ